MKKNILLFSLDAVIVILLVLLYNIRIFNFNLTFHEAAGLGIFGLFILHCLFKIKTIGGKAAGFFKKGQSARDRVSAIVGFLLFVDFVLILLSGVLISRSLFPSLGENPGTIWQSLHHFCPGLALILVGVHLGLHWQFVKDIWKPRLHLPQKLTTSLAVAVTVIVLAFGSYSMVASDFTALLVSPFTAEEGTGGSGGGMDMENMPDREDNGGEVSEGGGTPPEGSPPGSNSTTDDSAGDHSGGDGSADNDSLPEINGEGEDSGQGFPEQGQGGEMPQGFGELNDGVTGSPLAVLYTVVTYLSIIGVFAIATYYTDKLIAASGKTQTAEAEVMASTDAGETASAAEEEASVAKDGATTKNEL